MDDRQRRNVKRVLRDVRKATRRSIKRGCPCSEVSYISVPVLVEVSALKTRVSFAFTTPPQISLDADDSVSDKVEAEVTKTVSHIGDCSDSLGVLSTMIEHAVLDMLDTDEDRRIVTHNGVTALLLHLEDRKSIILSVSSEHAQACRYLHFDLFRKRSYFPDTIKAALDDFDVPLTLDPDIEEGDVERVMKIVEDYYLEERSDAANIPWKKHWNSLCLSYVKTACEDVRVLELVIGLKPHILCIPLHTPHDEFLRGTRLWKKICHALGYSIY